MPASASSIRHAAPPLQPVPPNERIAALDVLRGFALFGVLLAYTVWNLGGPPEHTYSMADRIINRTLLVSVDTKFYTLFAFLFGLGFSIQLTRARARGISIVPAYCRRLLALLLIGLAHALLLRNGDILVPYAVMGFLLLLFRNASNQMLAAGAIIGFVLPYAARAAWDLADIPFPERPDTEGVSYLSGNYAWVRYWYSTAITNWPASLPMFLFGLYMGRRHFFEDIAARRRTLRRALIASLCVGAFAYFARGWLVLPADSTSSFGRQLVLGFLWSAHAWGVATVYASFLLLLLQRRVWLRWLEPLGAVGRMALTNYLLQAVIIVPVCIAFALFDRVSPSLGVLLALGVGSIQLPVSVWWLNRFRFGPAEWLWRSLTYGRLQPLRVVDQPQVAA